MKNDTRTKPILMRKYREKKAFDQEQKRLKEKHGVSEDVIVVEKSNMAKFTVTLVISLVRLLITVLIVLLTATGLICLIYPLPREDFFKIVSEIANEVREFLRIF
jgi:hypothetical protein